MEFQELTDYIGFLNRFTHVKRVVKIPGEKDFENDSEHSYQLAMVSWYISEKLALGLKKGLILEYALAHDLVEVYAGDTDPHRSPPEFIATKEEREKDALLKIKDAYPGFHTLHRAIENYEALADDEAKFVYLLDKILPIINTHLSGDSYYKDRGVSYNRWKEWLESKQSQAKFNDKKFQALLKKVILYFKNVERGFFREV